MSENQENINNNNSKSEGNNSSTSLLSDDINSTYNDDIDSRPLTSLTEKLKQEINDSNSINNSSGDIISQGSAEIFGKLYHPHTPQDEEDMKDLDEITKIFNNSLTDISKGDTDIKNSNDKLNDEDNVENIVRDLSGFLNNKHPNDINKEPVRSLNDIINETGDNKDSQQIVEKVKEEYNRLSKLLVKSRMNETALYNKCTELSRFLNSCIIKIQSVLNVSKNDRINIVNLNLELEKAWKSIEKKNENESLLKETIELLKKEIVKYRKRVKGKLDDLPDNLIDDSSVNVEEENETTDYVKELEEVNNIYNIYIYFI